MGSNTTGFGGGGAALTLQQVAVLNLLQETGGDVALVGASLIVPDGETVRPATNEGAALGAAGKNFSKVNTVESGYTP